MELRSAENNVNEMMQLYESLRQVKVDEDDDESKSLLVSLLDALEPLPTAYNSQSETHNSSAGTKFQTWVEVLANLDKLHFKVNELEPKAARFRKRLSEKDPVSGNPRYGEQTTLRVTAFLESFGFLERTSNFLFGVEESNDGDGADSQSSTCVVERIRLFIKHQNELLVAKQQQIQAQEQQEKEKQRLLEEKKRALDQTQAQEEDARNQQEAELVTERANRIRDEQQRIREEQQREMEDLREKERLWVASVPKGIDSVRNQLERLKSNTENFSRSDRHTILTSLFTLFDQIVRHPEDVSFRRIRRDHEKFEQDIGRHEGGRELLLAAGFEIAILEGVSCFFLKEPNLETDLDKWSEWFDLLQAVHKLLKDEVANMK